MLDLSKFAPTHNFQQGDVVRHHKTGKLLGRIVEIKPWSVSLEPVAGCAVRDGRPFRFAGLTEIVKVATDG